MYNQYTGNGIRLSFQTEHIGNLYETTVMGQLAASKNYKVRYTNIKMWNEDKNMYTNLQSPHNHWQKMVCLNMEERYKHVYKSIINT